MFVQRPAQKSDIYLFELVENINFQLQQKVDCKHTINLHRNLPLLYSIDLFSTKCLSKMPNIFVFFRAGQKFYATLSSMRVWGLICVVLQSEGRLSYLGPCYFIIILANLQHSLRFTVLCLLMLTEILYIETDVIENCSKYVFKNTSLGDNLSLACSHMHHSTPPEWRVDLLPCHVSSLNRMLKRRWVISEDNLWRIKVEICHMW